ncbi:MAG: hypothetical protein ACXAE3_08380, partial [Candidatus Kariarchaeaceae archaeon]
MEFGHIHHIEIYVSNLVGSRSFWDWFFGIMEYSVSQEWSEGRSYKKGTAYIVLVQTEKDYLQNGYHRKNIGLNHLAFWGKSREHVDELRQILIQREIELLYDDKYPHASGEDYYA